MLSKLIRSKLVTLNDAEKIFETARALPIGRKGRKFELVIDGKKYQFTMHSMLKFVETLVKKDPATSPLNSKSLRFIGEKLTDIDKTSTSLVKNSKRSQKILTVLCQFFGNLFHARFDRKKLESWKQANLPTGSTTPAKPEEPIPPVSKRTKPTGIPTEPFDETPVKPFVEPFVQIPVEPFFESFIPVDPFVEIPIEPLAEPIIPDPVPISIPPGKEAGRVLKGQLIHFYLSQDARLLDLQETLKKSPEKKEAIRKEIVKIENSNIERSRFKQHDHMGYLGCVYKDSIEVSNLSIQLGKTVAETRAILFGQTYVKIFKGHLPEILAFFNSINGWDESELNKLHHLNNHKGGLDVNGLCELMKKAHKINPAAIEVLEKKLDQAVAEELKINVSDLDDWLQDLVNEQQFNERLTILGQEMVAPSSLDFKNSVKDIFEKNKIPSFMFPGAIWHHFTIGQSEVYVSAESQWKLFINPRPSEFLPTLDRVLNVLRKNNISCDGKIIGSDQAKRHSELSVLEDPCEPKFVLYFKGQNVEEEFKKGMQILEEEFKDADVIAAPKGRRKRRDGKFEVQNGPSFTKNRNNLMFYTQGGFTESGRDKIVSTATDLNEELAKKFEGENFYLHKGFTDPLANLTVNTISLEGFLDELETRIDAIYRPLQLVKLQNMVNRLRQEQPSSTDTEIRIHRLEKAIDHATKNLSIKRQRAMIQMLDYRSGMGDIQTAFSKAFFKKISPVEAEFNNNQARIQAQVEYVAAQAQAKIAVVDHFLSAALKGEMPSHTDFKILMDAVPLTLRDLFFASLGEEKKIELFEKILGEAESKLADYFKNNPAALGKSGSDFTGLWKGFLKKIDADNVKDKLFLRYRENRIGLFNVFMFRFFSYDQSSIGCRFVSKEVAETLFNKDEETFKFSDLKVSSEFLVNHLQIFKSKLESVRDRQLKRLEALKQGEAVSVPVYYHTAPLEAAASITGSGVEVTPAAKGNGAYVSTEPELTYGTVSFGFPELTGFTSDSDFFADYRGHTAIGGKQAIWSAFKEMLEVHPGTAQVRQQFLSSAQEVIRERIQQHALFLSLEQQAFLELNLLNKINQLLVFRMNSGMLQIGYRNDKSISLILNDNIFEGWIEALLESSRSMINAKSSQFPTDFNEVFLKGISKSFKDSFKHAMPQISEEFSIENWPKGKIKTTITAIDDDLKDYYLKVFGVVEGYRPGKTFATMSDVKKTLKEAGIDTEKIEFVPSFEQYIERDLREPFQEIPLGLYKEQK